MNTATAMTTSWPRRYRSLIVVALVASIIVLDQSDSPDVTTAGSANNGGFVTPGSGAVSSSGQPNASGAAVPGATAAAGPGSGGSDSGGSAATGAPGADGAGGQPVAVSAAAYPGYGTPEALESPKCDPATGKIPVPWARVPQCVRAWPEGADNGGSTSPGVTADTIKIAIRHQPGDSSPPDEDQAYQRAADACAGLTANYELWGRKVEVEVYNSSGTDESAMRADATEIANTIKPFMVIGTNAGASEPVLEGEYAGRGIVSFSWVAAHQATQDQAPYRWAFTPDERLTVFNVGEWIGKRLAHRPAQWAGDPALTIKPRKYGVIFPENAPIDVGELRSILGEHGVELAEVIAYPAGLVEQQSHARVAVAKLRDAGITTVISFADIVYTVLITLQATQDRYIPEWVVTGTANTDTYVAGRLFDQTQWSHAFGIGGMGTPVDGSANPLMDLHQWHYGKPPDDPGPFGIVCTPMLVAAAGLQLAGPNLTPETFQQGMFAWVPNGGKWQNMTTLGNEAHSFGRSVGVPWDDYSGQDDFTQKWWDPSTTGNSEIGTPGSGVYWKIEGARRFTSGTYPSGEPAMFVKEGAVSSYAEYPASDKAPEYPPPNRS